MASMALSPYDESMLSLICKGIKTTNKHPEAGVRGKTLLITGSNRGIGLACANMLPTLDLTHLIIAVRSVDQGEAAAAPIRKAHPGCKVEVWPLDMLSYPSIQGFAERCKTLQKLDIAILNAGVGGSTTSRINSSTGHEETIQVNYLSTALLRLTIVGSGSAFFAKFENRNANPLLPSFNIPFTGAPAASERYGMSKILVDMLVHELSQFVPADRVIINTVEPGLTSGTSLHRDFSGPARLMISTMKWMTAKTPEQAAWTYVDAVAIHGKESHGGFIMFWEVCGFPKIMYEGEGIQARERLWAETMVELEFAGVKSILESMRGK